MTGSRTADALVITQSPRRQLWPVGAIALFLAVYVVIAATGALPRWIGWAGVVVFGVVLLVGLYGLVRAHRASWELRLDPAGVTVQGHPTTPWSDLAEVRITGMRPRSVFPISFGVRRVAFIGAPGVELPPLPSVASRGLAARSAGLRHRWYGSDLVLMPSAFDASTDDIVQAVERFSEIPVRRS